jgi:hypothetical protein
MPTITVVIQISPIHTFDCIYSRPGYYYPPIHAHVFQVVTFLHTEFLRLHVPQILPLSYVHRSNIWVGVQPVKLLLSLAHFYFVSYVQIVVLNTVCGRTCWLKR